MKAALAIVTVAIGVALAGCSMLASWTNHPQTPEEARRAAALKVAQGHNLVKQGRYDVAMDVFVAAAANASVRSVAVSGAVEALDKSTDGKRLPDRLNAALMLQKRLPAGACQAQLGQAVRALLVAPVVKQVQQGTRLLRDRRAFVEQMRNTDQGDVLPTPANDRALTEGEVVATLDRMHDLGMPTPVVKLYMVERPLAAAMDRFLADDRRYLNQDAVTNTELDEISNSCDDLYNSLGPVQDQLDVVKPGWR